MQGLANTTCATVAADRGPEFVVVAAYETTVDRVRAIQADVTPVRWPELAGDTPAVLCYIDGFVPKAPPGGEPHDRSVIGVAGTHVDLIMSGYSDRLEIRAP